MAEPLKGKRFQEDGPIQGYSDHPEGNLLSVSDVKSAVQWLKGQLFEGIPTFIQGELVIEAIDKAFEDVLK